MKQDCKRLTLLDVDPPEVIFDKTFDKEFTWQEEFIITLEHIYSSIRIFFRNICFGVKNLFYYFPVIWHDRYWDFEYFFLQFLKYKLKSTRDGLVKENIIADINEVEQEINVLLSNIDNYENALDIFETNNQELLYKIKTEQNEDIKKELIREYCLKDRIYELEQFNKIFDYLKENCRKWWS